MNWRRIDGHRCKTAALYQLAGTDFFIRHCGHPTANFPYYGIRPDGTIMLAKNGMAFRTLAIAQTEIALIAWEELQRSA